MLVYETKGSTSEKDTEKRRKAGRDKFFSELERQGLQLEEVSISSYNINLYQILCSSNRSILACGFYSSYLKAVFNEIFLFSRNVSHKMMT